MGLGAGQGLGLPPQSTLPLGTGLALPSSVGTHTHYPNIIMCTDTTATTVNYSIVPKAK